MVPHAALIPLRGLVETGSGVSILTFSAFNSVAVQKGAVLKPYQIDLYAANNKTIKTFGMVERVRVQAGGYELDTNFVLMDDAMRVEDFLLGRNVLRAYQILVDLTSMKIVVRKPVQPVWHHVRTQVGDPTSAVPVALDHVLVLQPFERTVVKAKVVTSTLQPLIFQNVVLNAAKAEASLQNVVFLEDCLGAVSETGHVFVSVMSLTSKPQRIRGNTHLGTAVPVFLLYRAVPQQLEVSKAKTEVDKDRADFVNKIYEDINLSTELQFISLSEFEILSSTDPTEEGLSDREKRKRTHHELKSLIPGRASEASTSIENILFEFDDLFLKHKADIGSCTIAKLSVEVEPGAIPHREGARRMSPEKAEPVN